MFVLIIYKICMYIDFLQHTHAPVTKRKEIENYAAKIFPMNREAKAMINKYNYGNNDLMQNITPGGHYDYNNNNNNNNNNNIYNNYNNDNNNNNDDNNNNDNNNNDNSADNGQQDGGNNDAASETDDDENIYE